MAHYELNLHDYWRIIKKRRWIILLTALAVLGSVALFTNLQTPVYQASATVKVEPNVGIPGVASMDQAWDSYSALNTEVKILRSAIIAERAARKLGLVSDETTEEQRQAVSLGLLGKINAERMGETNLITISATSSDADEVWRLANAVADVYIEKGSDDRSRRAREMRQFIESQLDDAQAKLKLSEDALRDHTQKSGAKGIGGYLSTRLMDLQNRRIDLLKKYTAEHPDVRRIDLQIQGIETQMQSLPTEELEYGRLAREVKINEELYTLLAKRFKEAQISEADRVQLAFVVTPAARPAAPIKPNRTMNLAVGAFFGIFLGFVLAILFENLDTSIGTIEDVERYLEVPVLGVIPHIDPIAQQRKAGLLSRHPDRAKTKSELLRSKLIVHHPAKSPFAEAYHTLRTNISMASRKNGAGRVLAFSSAGISEGKTLTSANFAIAAAASGIKTLLVETDLRAPSVHRIFGIKRDPGFSDCLTGAKPWQEVQRGTTDFLMSSLSMEQILHAPGIENLRVITSGPIPANPIDLFNAATLSRVFREMAASYDLVICDCPPILPFADTLITGAAADSMIIVYRAGKMARSALKRAKDQLVNLNVPVLGVVLNDITSSDMEPQYGYYYSARYYARNEES